METTHNDKNYLLYDGECPFCTSFSRFYEVKKALPNIEIVSMRDAERLKSLSLPQDLNFNYGMILVLEDGRILQGEPAFHLINGNVKKTSLRDHIVMGMNSIKSVTKVVYPLLFKMRLVVLKCKDVSPDMPRVDLGEPIAPASSARTGRGRTLTRTLCTTTADELCARTERQTLGVRDCAPPYCA